MQFDYTTLRRFWRKVDQSTPNGCWEWKNATRNGYGCIRVDRILYYAHRLSYEIHVGPIPDDKLVIHTCDNRLCVNPAHLKLGTYTDNMLDMYAKGRGKGGSKQGARRKITPEQVRLIRKLSAEGIRHPALAKQFGITIPAVSLIVSRKRWKNIE